MSGFDITVIVVTVVLVVFGLIQGIVRILVTLGALALAFVAASQFHQPLAAAWTDSPEGPSGTLKLIAYLLVFFAVMLAGGLAAWLLRKLIRAALLGWADRLAGAALAFVVAVTGLALLILPVVAYTPKGERLLQRSVLAPYLVVVADLANHLVPEDLSRRYRERIEELRRAWRGEDMVRLESSCSDRPSVHRASHERS